MNIRLLVQAGLACILPLLDHPPVANRPPVASFPQATVSAPRQSGPWPAGLAVKPHPSVDVKAFEQHYREDKALWDKAFAFLSRKDLASLAPGKYPIDGENVFATVTEKPSREFSVSEWEPHRKYLDIHYVLSGKQRMGIASLDDVTVRQPYDEKRDVVFYNDTGKGNYYLADSTAFFICYPTNPHRPDIRADGYPRSKKLVIKIRTK